MSQTCQIHVDRQNTYAKFSCNNFWMALIFKIWSWLSLVRIGVIHLCKIYSNVYALIRVIFLLFVTGVPPRAAYVHIFNRVHFQIARCNQRSTCNLFHNASIILVRACTSRTNIMASKARSKQLSNRSYRRDQNKWKYISHKLWYIKRSYKYRIWNEFSFHTVFMKRVVCFISPSLWRGNIKHTTSFINTVWNENSFQILFITW